MKFMEYVRTTDVLAMLHSIGGCDAEKGSWADGWDEAVNEAFKRVSNMGNCELEFICEFAKETDLEYKLAQKQLRSLWTAYCFHNDICCDTRRYDAGLSKIWDIVCKNDTCPWKDDEEELVIGFDMFDTFMCEEVV